MIGRSGQEGGEGRVMRGVAVENDAASEDIAYTGEALGQARRDDIGHTMCIHMRDGGDGVVDDDRDAGLGSSTDREKAFEIDAAEERVARGLGILGKGYTESEGIICQKGAGLGDTFLKGGKGGGVA